MMVVLTLSSAQAIQFVQVTDCCPPYDYYYGHGQPAFSPDGNFIAYVEGGTFPPAYEYFSRIEIYSFGPVPPEFPSGGLGETAAPTWSPDGTKIAFSQCANYTSPSSGLYVGTENFAEPLVQWVSESCIDRSAFLPSGGMIFGTWSGIQLVSGPGMTPVSLGISGSQPALHEQGLAYVSGDRIWIDDGNGARRVEAVDNGGRDRWPSWSPDGRFVVFSSDRNGGIWNLWVVPSVGGTAIQLTFADADDVTPTWSPDGKSIAFASRRGGEMEIWLATDLPDFTTNVESKTWSEMKQIYR
jgi:hypothetical protein